MRAKANLHQGVTRSRKANHAKRGRFQQQQWSCLHGRCSSVLIPIRALELKANHHQQQHRSRNQHGVAPAKEFRRTRQNQARESDTKGHAHLLQAKNHVAAGWRRKLAKQL